MPTVYGNTTNHWRAYFVYEVSETATEYTVKVTQAGFQSVGYGFQIYNSAISTEVLVNGSRVAKGSGDFYSPNGSTVATSYATATHKVKKATSAQSLTVKVSTTNASGFMDGTSTASVAVSVPALASYYVHYDANGGTGAPADQTKWYGQNLSLSTTRPTRAGHTFLGWAETTLASPTYQPGATYAEDADLFLYASWKTDYIAPTVSGLKAYRCSEDGSFDDEGTRARVLCSWSVDTSLDSGNVATSVVVERRSKGIGKVPVFEDEPTELQSDGTTSVAAVHKTGLSTGFVAGREYVVVINGVEHRATAYDVLSDDGETPIHVIGNMSIAGEYEDTGETFLGSSVDLTSSGIGHMVILYTTELDASALSLYEMSTDTPWEAVGGSTPMTSRGELDLVPSVEFSLDSSFEVRVTVADPRGSSSATTILTSASFPLDIGNMGGSIGLFCSASDLMTGLDVGDDARFHANVMLKDSDKPVHERLQALEAGTRQDAAYVVETGVQNTWMYRKWSDGSCDCWKTFEAMAQKFDSAYGNAYFKSYESTFPFAFKEVPHVQVTVRTGSGGIMGASVHSSTTNEKLGFYVYSLKTEASIDLYVQLRATGELL